MSVISGTFCCAQNAGNDAPAPVAPVLPAAYQKDQVLPGSVSPDEKYGFIYPNEEQLNDPSNITDFRLLLVELSPFRVLIEVPCRYGVRRGHSGYKLCWAKNSSAVVMNETQKWGPIKVYSIPIKNGQVSKICELTSKIENLVRPGYKKSGAAGFNDTVDFIFESDYLTPGNGQALVTQEVWCPNETGQVNIRCFCTDDPKDEEKPSWTVQFDGTWNIAQGKFTQRKITRLRSGRGKNLSLH